MFGISEIDLLTDDPDDDDDDDITTEAPKEPDQKIPIIDDIKDVIGKVVNVFRPNKPSPENMSDFHNKSSLSGATLR